jgi:hypothetical protein
LIGIIGAVAVVSIDEENRRGGKFVVLNHRRVLGFIAELN